MNRRTEFFETPHLIRFALESLCRAPNATGPRLVEGEEPQAPSNGGRERSVSGFTRPSLNSDQYLLQHESDRLDGPV